MQVRPHLVAKKEVIMNKIICDVCGTAYPETASQCPICGCARTADTAASGEQFLEDTAAASTYNYVKGGRFSKNNVRKRNKNQPETRVKKQERPVREESPEPDVPAEEVEETPTKSNRGLVITVVALLLAIMAVVMYIALKYFIPIGGFDKPNETTLPPAQPSTVETTSDGLIHCTGLNLTDTTVTLDGEGRQWLLNVTAEPMDTTDIITYSSSDESVVTVSESGTLTAVSEGSCVITITCGAISVECNVTCAFTEPTTAPIVTDPVETQPVVTQPVETEPVETQPAETTAPAVDPSKTYTMKVNGTKRKTYDVTLKVGQSLTLTLEDENGNAVDVDWKTNGPSYLTVKGNKITAKAVCSAAKVYVTIGDTTYTCVVRVVKK